MIIVDTGIFVAANLPNDQHHEPCLAFFLDSGDELAVTDLVVAEVAYLLARWTRGRRAPEAPFLRLLAEGRVLPLAPTMADYGRMADLVEQYADLPLGAADASVVAIAERLGVTRIATVDRRDFGIVRPRHVGGFELVPAL